MAITTRSGKGSPLTHNEMDANLSAITEKTSATGSVKGSSGTTAQRPASPVEGYTRFNTTLNRHETYNGSTWITAVSSANTDTSDMSFVVDEDAMTSDSATKVPTQQSVKAYVDSQVQSKDALSELSGTLDDVADGTTYVKSTNDFTDAEVTKLSGIETAATADQTNAEIKTAYEANADTNEFSDAEQTKLSGIEASADVTDSTNVASAGAVMESDTTTASMSFVIDQDDMSTDSATKVPTQQSVKAYVDSQVQSKDTLGELGGNLDDITDGTTYKKMSATEQTKLSGIEASADVTDTTNVTSAGALMDSEVTNLAQVKAFDTTDYATSTQGTTADNALPLAGGTMTGTIAGFTSTGIDDNATSTKITVADTGIDVTGSVTSDGLTVNDTGGASISYGYSLINSSARNGSGSIQLSSIPSIAMLLDYHDANQTVATVRNTYGATSALAELALDSGFITFNTGTSFTERMRIDSEGAVTMPSQPAFSAYINAAQNNLGVALYVDLQFNAETFDQGNDFNTGTYEFTAPVTGKYQLQVYTRMSGIDTAANYTRINIATSNRNYTTIDDPNYTSDLDYHTQRIMVLADMDAGDTAKVQFYQSGGSAVADAINGANSNNFSGYLVA